MHNKRVDNKAFYAREICPSVWRITSCFVNVYLVIGEKKAAVIDAGYGFSDLQRFVRQITDKPLVLLLTHGHFDHAPGLGYFDCDIYLHPADQEVLNRHLQSEIMGAAFSAPKIERIVMPWHRPIDKDFSVEALLALQDKKILNLADGMEFDLGGLTLRAIHLPGHTKGSVGFLLPEKKLLFAGDAVNGNLFLQLPESTMLSEYIRTLYKTKDLDFEWFCQGHGKPVPKDNLDDFIYVAEHLEFASGKLEKGGTLFSQSEIRNCRDRKRHAGIVIAKDKIG